MREARTSDENIDESPGAGLPPRETCRMEDADQGTYEVLRVRIRAEIPVVYGALNRTHERGMNEGS